MNNLEKLEKEIRSKLPHLMELKEGCLLKTDGDLLKIIGVKKDGSYRLVQLSNLSFESFYESEILSHFQVIGQEIKLNHVLEWHLLKKEEDFKVWGQLKHLAVINFWNIQSEYLKDQSEELIDYLRNLIL